MAVVILIRLGSSFNKFRGYINKFKNNLRNVKSNTNKGMTNTGLIIIFKMEMRYGCKLEKKGYKGKVKNSNPFAMVLSRS